MAQTCRTCTQQITSNEYFYIDGSSLASGNVQIKDLLLACIPEFDVHLIPNTTICRNCVLSLHIAYEFKIQVLRNQEQLQAANVCSTKEELSGINTNSECRSGDNAAVVTKIEVEDVPIDSIGLEYQDLNYVELLPETLRAENERTCVFEPIKRSPEDQNEAETVDCNSPPLILSNYLQLARKKQPSSDKNVKPRDCPPLASLQSQNRTDDQHSNSTETINGTAVNDRQLQEVMRPFKCTSCKFSSNSKAGLVMHMRIHTGERPYHCPICPHTSKRKSHLEVHLKMHDNRRDYKCPLCDDQFKTEVDTKKHLIVHFKEKPFKCNQCDFRSRHKVSVAHHVKRIHRGIKDATSKVENCICYVCGKTLRRPSSLRVHMRIHTGAKPHLCELCGKHFRELGNLKHHMATHTGEKLFKCAFCDYCSARKAHLEGHMRIYGDHLGLVSCSICERRYASQWLMVRHVHEEHKIQDFQVPRRRNRNKEATEKEYVDGVADVDDEIDEETNEAT